MGLTEDSQRFADEHYNEYLEAERKRQEEYNQLEESTLQEDADKARMDKYRPGGAQSTDASTNEEGENDQDNAGGDGAAVSAEAFIHEGFEGVSKRKFIMDADNETEQQLEDKYTSRIDATPDNADENERRDAVTVGRENFLSIYNERQGGGDDD